MICRQVERILDQKLFTLTTLDESMSKVEELLRHPDFGKSTEAPVGAVAQAEVPGAAENEPARDASGSGDELLKLQHERDMLKLQLESAQAELRSLRSKMSDLETSAASVDKLRDELNDCRTEIIESRRKVSAAEARYNECYQQLSEVQSKCAGLESDLSQSMHAEYEARAACTELDQKFKNLQNEKAGVDQELSEVRLECESLRVSLNDYEQTYALLNQQYAQLTENFRTAEASAQSLESQLAGSLENNKQLEAQSAGLRTELDNTQALLASAQTQISNLTADKMALQQNLEAAQQRADSAEQMVASLKALQNRVFPNCLSIPALAPYVADWKLQMVSESPNPKLLSMLAQIFSWASAKETAERCADVPASILEKDSISALYNFSRYFFDTLYSQNVEPEAAERIASDLMDTINNELLTAGAKYEIVLPYSGERYDSKTMIADSRGSGVGEIYMLRSWGIKNRANDVMHAKSLVQLS